jgi:hypothetical protein
MEFVGFKCLFQALSEIHRIMLQDTCTKDVFKEMDGFLYLMSVLSSIQDRPTGVAVVEPEAQVLQETIQCTRWVFLIFSEAMKNHHANTEYFRVSKWVLSSKYTTRFIFTESCWLRVLEPRVRWASVRTKDNIGNIGILTLFIAVRLLSFQFLLQPSRCTTPYHRRQNCRISSGDD